MTDTNDPREIVKDMCDTFIVAAEYLGLPKEAVTSADARKLAISAHIEASKKGYRSLNPAVAPKVEEKPKVEQEAQGEPQEAPKDEAYDYRKAKHVPTYQAKKDLKELIILAVDNVREENNLGIQEATRTVKHQIMEAFTAEWKFGMNITTFNNMTMGQVVWTIHYIQKTWGVE